MAINKVMVVDDAEPDRLHLKSILNDAGFQVVLASSGREALERAQNDVPDLVMLDIVMDEMDGFKTCRKLTSAAATQHIPVIMVSGNKQKVDRIWARRQGAKSYITKPYTADQVIDEISKFN